MSKQLMMGVKYLWRGTCVMAVLLLLCVMLFSSVQTANAQDARITALNADVAAGTDIAVIIQNAVAAGLTVSQAVEAIVKAGVDPGRVTYAAITANFSPADVVRGAADAVETQGLSDSAFQAQITLIDSVARQAGASESQINSGLSSAGVPAGVIANANSQAIQSPAPVFGYTTPYTPPPTGGIGGTGGTGFIGGSGIGAPENQASGSKPASPSKP
jgi:hypothetical protein